MESALISDDESSDNDIKSMKDQLSDFGLDEDNLTKEEMKDLLKALTNSQCTEKEEEILRQNTSDRSPCTNKPLKRRYKNVRDRRLPWSLLPDHAAPAERARALAVYIKLMAICRHRQARLGPVFAEWPPPIEIVQESGSRLQHSLRSTRSGRTVPDYCADMDDDSSDVDFVVTKPKKRKVSGSDNPDGVYSNKVVSLKRKTAKEEVPRPLKEPRVAPPAASPKTKRAGVYVIED